MKVPQISYAPLYEANSALYDGKRSSLVAESMGRIDDSINLSARQVANNEARFGLAERSLKLQAKAIKNNRADSVARFALSLGEIAINAIPEITNIIKQGQLETAKSSLMSMQAEYNVMQETSILNGQSRFEQGADGMLSFVEDPRLQQWQDQKLAEIDASTNFKDVKAWTASQAKSLFLSGQDRALSVAVANAKTTANALFEQGMVQAETVDVQGGTYENGLGRIRSNSTLGPMQKAYMEKAYIAQVDYRRATDTIKEIAHDSGEAAAREALKTYKLPTEQIDAIEKELVKSDAEGTVQLSESVYTTVLDRMGKGDSPESMRKEYEKTLAGQPPTRRQLAMESFDKAQLEYVKGKGEAQWKKDRNNTTILGMKTARDAVYADQAYKGAEATQKVFLDRYDSEIDAMQRAEAASSKSGKEIDIERINAQAAYRAFMNGEVGGTDTISYLNKLGGDAYDPVTQSTINGLIRDVKDNLLPEQFKRPADDFIKEIEYSVTGGKEYGKLNDQQKRDMSDVSTFAHGALLDLFYETKAGAITNDIFNERLDTIRKSTAIKQLDVIQKETIIVGPNNSKALQGAQAMASVFETVDPVYIHDNGTVNWVNPKMKESFDQMNIVFRQDLESRGIQIRSQTMEKQGRNDVIPRMIFTDTKGNDYYYDGKGLNQKKNGANEYTLFGPSQAAEIAGSLVTSAGKYAESKAKETRDKMQSDLYGSPDVPIQNVESPLLKTIRKP